MVLQEPFLFAGTIADNVRFARPDASDEEVREVAEAVGLDRVAARLEGGLMHHVREGGAGISAGERQLISIARALLADPRILILDEATSNIDRPTEIVIERALDRLLHRRTSLIIAHRLATIRRADEVLVLERGVIVQRGSERDLRAADGPFRRLAEELAMPANARPRRSNLDEQCPGVAGELPRHLGLGQPCRQQPRPDDARDVRVAGPAEARELALQADVVAVHELRAVAGADQLEQRRDALVVGRHAIGAVLILVAPQVERDRAAAREQRPVVVEARGDLRVEMAEHRAAEIATARLDDVEGLVPPARERVQVDVQRDPRRASPGPARRPSALRPRSGRIGSEVPISPITAGRGPVRAELRQQRVAVVRGGPGGVVVRTRLRDVGPAAHHDVEPARAGDRGEPVRDRARPSRASRRSRASSRAPRGG